MRYVRKVLGWADILVLPFLTVGFCVWFGSIFRFSEAVSAAGAIGLMLIGLTYELRDKFESIDHSIKDTFQSINDTVESIKDDVDSIKETLDPEFDD